MKVNIDEALKGKELYNFLVANKKALIAEKKYNVKHADGFTAYNTFMRHNGDAVKANKPITEDLDMIKVSSIINTTNLIDSHKDVHIPGIWDKSLSESKGLYLLQEHQMTFKGIITDEVQAFTRQMKWTDLGVNAKGETQALVFVSNIYKHRNEFMFNEYKMARVKNHSVGMRYVRIEMAINDEDYKEEYAVWNKYIDQIVNKQEAEEEGYFWAVKEAKVVEGSAVPVGSNWATPTTDNNLKSDTAVPPPASTELPPSTGTIDFEQLLKNIKIN